MCGYRPARYFASVDGLIAPMGWVGSFWKIFGKRGCRADSKVQRLLAIRSVFGGLLGGCWTWRDTR